MSENNPETSIKVKIDVKNQSRDQIQEKNSQDEQLNYYNQFSRLYLANAVLMTQLKQLNVQRNQLFNKLNKLEKKAEEIQDGTSQQNQDKKRRVRRSATEIARHYRCKIQSCGKSYGSEGSLNQHLKIKHPDLFKELVSNSNNQTLKQQSYGESYDSK